MLLEGKLNEVLIINKATFTLCSPIDQPFLGRWWFIGFMFVFSLAAIYFLTVSSEPLTTVALIPLPEASSPTALGTPRVQLNRKSNGDPPLLPQNYG